MTGMQGSTDDGNGYLKTITTCKHFAGFNSGFNLGSNQDQGFNALIDDRDMADTYLPAFRACITQAKVRLPCPGTKTVKTHAHVYRTYVCTH